VSAPPPPLESFQKEFSAPTYVVELDAQPELVIVPTPPLPISRPIRKPTAAPSFDLDQLVGLREVAVVDLFGQPTDISEEIPGKTWNYRRDSCTLTVTFFPELTSRAFHVLMYKVISNDSTAISANACRTRFTPPAAKRVLEP